MKIWMIFNYNLYFLNTHNHNINIKISKCSKSSLLLGILQLGGVSIKTNKNYSNSKILKT